MLGQPIRPSSGALLTIYSIWYYAPTLLLTGATVAPVSSSVGALYQKLYIQSKVLLRMGELVARNM